MVEVLLAKDLIDYPSTKLHDYLLVISDLVDKARSTNEDAIGRLVRLYSRFSTTEELAAELIAGIVLSNRTYVFIQLLANESLANLRGVN